MRIAFKTFGCKANSTDTDALYLEAKKRGFKIVPESDRADAYVINSCTVTEAADRDARQQATRLKRQNPLSLVAVIGCYAQVARDELLSLPEVDFVVGTANKFKILDLVEEALRSGQWDRDQVEAAKGFLPERFPGSRHCRATVKVQDGCNFNCSFCIIPQARGRSRSLEMGLVLSQIEEAYRQGFQEVVLTGIHLAHYGWDRGTDLMALLERIFQTKDGPRIRLSTLDPFEIPDSLISLLKTQKRLCPHFHIALQSGSDRVLKGMRRIYKAEEFVAATAKIQGACPDTFIGVDVIVGFPGEGEKEFQQTVEVLNQTPWAKLHVFPYSEREGTKAIELGAKVPERLKHERVQQLLRLSEKRYSEFLQSQVGKPRDAILEKPSSKRPGYWLAHSENYLPLLVSTAGGGPKSLLPVYTEAVDGDRLIARALH